MSGGQDEASNDIESSGGNTIKCPHCLETLDYDERGRNWLCERCGILWSSKLWSHRMSQRKSEIEREMCEGTDKASNDIESSGDWETPTIEHTWTPEAYKMRCTIREAIEIADGIAKRADERRQAEIERELCEGIDELVDTLKKENDVMERDTRGPAIVSVGSVNTGLKFYGPFVSIEDAVAWLHDCNLTGATTVSLLETPPKANIRSPQYESHTMESLLPLANEWVRANESDVVVRIGSMTPKSVWIMGFRPSEWSYDELRIVLTWATGPHAGKPVAREVG